MEKASEMFNKLLNVAMAAALVIMGTVVFGNVVLRYVFNSGLTWSEELSRYLFIWLTFLGAIGALRDHQHLAVDAIVKRLPHSLKKAVFVLRSVIILFLLYLFLDGTRKFVLQNMGTPSPALGINLAWVYSVGLFASVAMMVFVVSHVVRMLRLKADLKKYAEAEGPINANEEPRTAD